MKKRFLSVFLALALCMGLAAPAFAADSEVPAGSYTVDLDAPDPDEMGVDGEFMVRYLNSSRSYDKAQPRVDITRTLPQGSEFTWAGLRSSHNVYFRFFTDLDNDGTYDERLVVKESGKNVLAPYAEKYDFSLTQVSGKSQSAGTFASMVEEMGGKLSKDSSGVMTLAISSDSLCEFFGGSTLFEWGVMKNGSSVVAKGTMLFAAGEPSDDPDPDNTAGPGTPVPEFTDTPDWCKADAQWAAQKGITNGYGGETTFAPGRDCTQAEILTFLWRAAGKPTEGIKTPVANVKESDYFYHAVMWANDMGMIDPGTFDPSKPCTRSQAVSYIWQALGKTEAGQAASFTDVPDGAAYAKAVDWAVEKGITKGDGGEDTFAPDKVCSRGHIACFLYRAYNS